MIQLVAEDVRLLKDAGLGQSKRRKKLFGQGQTQRGKESYKGRNLISDPCKERDVRKRVNNREVSFVGCLQFHLQMKIEEKGRLERNFLFFRIQKKCN
ncbi:hypothetical protein CEXT_144781 [Caerostris extrusa]|uniref:Uncharacterized protein n=1 Tax=Caerostris extrusa TaxID=172846 RepID=A0AAV4X1N3_CAEEX|nr:hypothetical protein CEXT_144781 [Caerostris extrusa]